MNRQALLFGILVACAAPVANAQNQTLQTELESRTTFVAKPGTVEHQAVAQWLKQRAAEGQFPVFPAGIVTPSLDDLGILTITGSSTRQFHGPVSTDPESPNSIILPDPLGTLPVSGNPGQHYNISDCTPMGTNTTYEYVWVPSSNGQPGYWDLVKVVYEKNAKVCG